MPTDRYLLGHLNWCIVVSLLSAYPGSTSSSEICVVLMHRPGTHVENHGKPILVLLESAHAQQRLVSWGSILALEHQKLTGGC